MGLNGSPPGVLMSGQILYRVDSNKITDLAKLSQSGLRHYRGNHIAMIFQEPMTSLNPVFTCGNQLSEAIRVHRKISKKEARKVALDLFSEVLLPGPEEIYRSYPHQLSGGQKQRVMIAMAVSCHPAILIAEEPTTALDVTVQKHILELIGKLQRKYDMSVIFISHDLGVISEIADDVVVMKDGIIVESGSLKKVFHHPEHPYTQGLLACRPGLSVKYKRLPTVQDFLEGKINGNFPDKYLEAEDGVEKKSKAPPEKPLLKVRDLRTWFPGKRNFFGVPGYGEVRFGEDGSLSIERMAGTQRACPEDQMRQELTFLQALTSVRRYDLDGDRMRLYGGGDAPLIRLVRAGS